MTNPMTSSTKTTLRSLWRRGTIGIKRLWKQVRETRFMALRWRLTFLYTGLMALLLLLISVSVYAALQNNLFRAVRNDLASNFQQVSQLIGSSRNSLPTGSDWNTFPADSYAEVSQLPSFGELTPEMLADVNLRISGKSLNLSYTNTNVQAFVTLPDIQAYTQLLRERRYVGETTLTVGKERIPALVLAAYTPEVPVPTSSDAANFEKVNLVQFVAQDLTPILGTLQSVRTILAFVSLIGLVAAAMGAYWLAGRGLQPIRAVRDAAETVTGSNLSLRVPEQGTQDEVDDLARTLNGMLERLEDAFESQRRFTADASHELRTPVTAINGHASYLMRRTNPTPEQRESLQAITTLGNRLSGLIGDLLDLARGDAGLGVELAEVSLLNLAEDVHLEVVAIAGKSEILIEGQRNLIVRADANRMRQVVRNLVQNAIKAGSTEILVNVTLEQLRTTVPLDKGITSVVRLSVIDNGPGIPQEHLSKLFDRFYRVDTARDRAAGGSGLGLSIVRWIVEAHGGTVGISSQVGLGTRFDVRLPLVRIAPEILSSSIEDDVA
jgi:two-component system, OmpR family, sensor kinase